MLRITSAQWAILEKWSFERYVDRLTQILRSESFSGGVSRRVPEPDSLPAVRQLACDLVAQANALGIECEGDVTPFCLLAVCDDVEFQQSGLYDWVAALVRATEFSAEERMDAVYSLLPKTVRDKVFLAANEAGRWQVS